MRVENSNKVLICIFVFITSVYFSTLIHEFGHGISYFALGCKSVGVFVSPLIVGFTECFYPKDIKEHLTQNQIALSTVSGILFALIVGIILFVLYKYTKIIKKYYVLSLILFFFSFSSLSNTFLQSLAGGDLRVLLELNVNRAYLIILTIVSGSVLLSALSEFKDLLKRVEPKISSTEIKSWYRIFLTFIVISLVLYFGLPFIL